jgi:hypothetical protein
VNGFRFAAALAALVLLMPGGNRASAETAEVRVSKGYGILYLPLIVMADQKLLEKHAAKAGLGNIKVTWESFDGGNVINDAMLAGAIEYRRHRRARIYRLVVEGARQPERSDRRERAVVDVALSQHQ